MNFQKEIPRDRIAKEFLELLRKKKQHNKHFFLVNLHFFGLFDCYWEGDSKFRCFYTNY